MLYKPAVIILFSICLVCTQLLSATLVDQNTTLSLSTTAFTTDPNSVTVIVDILRFRAMAVDALVPAFTFEVTIGGTPSLMDNNVYRELDCWFGELSASRTIDYNLDTLVNITVTVTERSLLDVICDISPRSNLIGGRTLSLSYDLKHGAWFGDDYLGDSDGYGHANGFADGNERQQDGEIWFNIHQVEAGCADDSLTYWEKTNLYNLDPNRSYAGQDADLDGIPIEWEDAYGYDPFVPENHATLDPDQDGLTNLQEYTMADWLADPFAQNIYIEIDGMEGPFKWSPPYILPEPSQHLLCNVFSLHNITVIIDDGLMGEGGEFLPYDNTTSYDELWNTRNKYFLKWQTDNERRGIFHYAVICAQIDFTHRPAGGCAFAIDSHVIAAQYVKNWLPSFIVQGSDHATAFASVFMHELGHTLGLNHYGGIDNEESRFPWNKEFWEWSPYRSCMNYRYVYKVIDYSIGDDDDHDRNDWNVLDLVRFSRGD